MYSFSGEGEMPWQETRGESAVDVGTREKVRVNIDVNWRSFADTAL